MVSRSEIVKEALSWSNTPWHHHQGVKGVGTDCVQFVLGVGKSVGFVPVDYKIENYEPLARGSFLVRQLEQWLVRVEKYKKGSVLLMNCGGLDTHVGIVVDPVNFVHASARHKAVVMSPISRYKSMIKWIYDVPGVEDG
jgi:cell wall-associated NlpC family hydrolase